MFHSVVVGDEGLKEYEKMSNEKNNRRLKVATLAMESATETVIDYMYVNEENNFFESLDEDDRSYRKNFCDKLEAHILYSLIIMKCVGDMRKVSEMVDELWNDYGENVEIINEDLLE